MIESTQPIVFDDNGVTALNNKTFESVRVNSSFTQITHIKTNLLKSKTQSINLRVVAVTEC